MAILTFGKNKGKDTNTLAKSSNGRDYLQWCVQNLDSPKWRNECKSALVNNKIEAEVEINSLIEEGLTYDGAKYWADKALEDQEKEDAFQSAVDTLKNNLVLSGVPENKVSAIAGYIASGQFDDMVEFGKIQFSSKEKEQAIYNCIAQFEIDIEEV